MVASGWLLEARTSEAESEEDRGRSGDKRVGSEEASLQRPCGGLPCSPPLCHPMTEGQLSSMGWLSSRGPLKSCWCYVCRDINIPPAALQRPTNYLVFDMIPC